MVTGAVQVVPAVGKKKGEISVLGQRFSTCPKMGGCSCSTAWRAERQQMGAEMENAED